MSAGPPGEAYLELDAEDPIKTGHVGMLGFPKSVDKDLRQRGPGVKKQRHEPVYAQGVVAFVGPHFAAAGYKGGESMRIFASQPFIVLCCCNWTSVRPV